MNHNSFAEEGFPFLGEINQENVNIRAGQSISFEKLGRMSKGEEVVVIGKDFSWLKIKLPTNIPCYINDKYVKDLEIPFGEVTADRVNLRAMPNANSTSLGQITLGTKLQIVEKKDGWVKILPPSNTVGWVSVEFVTFKSKDIASYKFGFQETLPSVASPITPNVTATANLNLIGDIKTDETGSFVLSISDILKYAIDADQEILKQYLNCKVTVEGILNGLSSLGTNVMQTVKISQIKLIL